MIEFRLLDYIIVVIILVYPLLIVWINNWTIVKRERLIEKRFNKVVRLVTDLSLVFIKNTKDDENQVFLNKAILKTFEDSICYCDEV